MLEVKSAMNAQVAVIVGLRRLRKVKSPKIRQIVSFSGPLSDSVCVFQPPNPRLINWCSVFAGHAFATAPLAVRVLQCCATFVGKVKSATKSLPKHVPTQNILRLGSRADQHVNLGL